MSDGDYGDAALGGEATQGSEQGGFGAAIEGGSAFIEDEDLRLADEGTGESDSLALAAGQLRALLAHHGIETVGEFRKQMGTFGSLHGFEDFAVSGIELSHAHVVADGAIEEEHVLADETDLRAEAGDRDVAQVDAIEEDDALGWIIETQNQLQESGFAATASSHDDDKLAVGNFECEIVQDRMVSLGGFVFGGRIGETNVLKTNALGERLE